MHRSKYIKYNRPHKVEHYREIAWCCKTNFKTNLPRLETKKGEPCPHSFKYVNCKDNHQADNNLAYSGSTDSTRNNMQKNIKSSVKIKTS